MKRISTFFTRPTLSILFFATLHTAVTPSMGYPELSIQSLIREYAANGVTNWEEDATDFYCLYGISNFNRPPLACKKKFINNFVNQGVLIKNKHNDFDEYSLNIDLLIKRFGKEKVLAIPGINSYQLRKYIRNTYYEDIEHAENRYHLIPRFNRGSIEKIKLQNHLLFIFDQHGRTILHHAHSLDSDKSRALCCAKGNPNAIDIDGNTPLFYACFNKYSLLDTVTNLLNAGADANAINFEGYTSLFYASENNNPEFAKTLLAAGANPNIADKNGTTPLHITLMNSKLETLKALLDFGAIIPNENIKQKIIHIAQEHDRHDIIEIVSNMNSAV